MPIKPANIEALVSTTSDEALAKTADDHTPNRDLKLRTLYKIFEKHLYDFHDDTESQEEFVEGIVAEYMAFLRTGDTVVVNRYASAIKDELRHQVTTMLLKKSYGCLTLEVFLDMYRKRK